MLGIKDIEVAVMPAVVYQKQNPIARRIVNVPLMAVTKLGLSPRGAYTLSVRGRTSGEWRSTPVNPLSLGGERYLVAPRGDTHWARNLRAAGQGVLKLGRKQESISVVEVTDAEKAPVIRAYLEHWRPETGKFFGVPKEASDAELEAIAPMHPVFRIVG